MLERDFQKKVLKDLDALGSRDFPTFVLKTQERGRRGVPDIHVTYKGRAIWIELKAENGKLAPLQQRTLARIHLAGGLSFVARPSTWPAQFQMLRTL